MSETKVQKEGLFLRKEDIPTLSTILMFAKIGICGVSKQMDVDPLTVVKLIIFCDHLQTCCDEVIPPNEKVYQEFKKLLLKVNLRETPISQLAERVS